MALSSTFSRDAVQPTSRAEAARETALIEAELAAHGRTVLDELAVSFTPGEHYPDGEVWDDLSHAQYFYHAHPEGGRHAEEHGHFHTFLGHAGMPRGTMPLVLPEMAMVGSSDTHGRGVGTHRSPRDRGMVSHLIAVTVDPRGQPISLFTTNRWVTGETWFRAEDIARMLPGFAFAGAAASPLSRWLAGVLTVLRPHIVALVRDRDDKIMDWRRRRSRQTHVFDDRRLEVVSERRIDFAAETGGGAAGLGMTIRSSRSKKTVSAGLDQGCPARDIQLRFFYL